MAKEFKAVDHGNHPIDLRGLGSVTQLRPIELHHNSNGSLKNEPTFAIVMGVPGVDAPKVIGQLSLEMWNETLKELGYSIVKNK